MRLQFNRNLSRFGAPTVEPNPTLQRHIGCRAHGAVVSAIDE
jgi:hypothetical protein